jgi:hypothetical protein
MERNAMPQKSPRSTSHKKSTSAKSRAKKPVVSVIADVDPTHHPAIPVRTVPGLLDEVLAPRAQQPAEAAPALKSPEPAEPRPAAAAPVAARPPRSLGGLLRKVASARSDSGLLLKLADRVDVWEHRLRRSLPWSVPTAAVLTAGLVWRARRA